MTRPPDFIVLIYPVNIHGRTLHNDTYEWFLSWYHW